MSKVDLYYFSGTGNSLHIARELQKRIPENNLIPMVSLLDKPKIETDGKMVGLVFPIYFTTIPRPVKEFIKKLDLKSTPYIFAVATRIGTTHSAFSVIDKILKKCGRRLDAAFSINMASNDPKFNYKVPTEAEIAKLAENAYNKLDSIAPVIINQIQHREKDTSFITHIPLLQLIAFLVNLTDGLKAQFYTDSKCNGCGICEKVCLSKKITMKDNKPVWLEKVKCYHCSACLNYCPVQSIQLKSLTEKNGRYPHPYATASDIAGQKLIMR